MFRRRVMRFLRWVFGNTKSLSFVVRSAKEIELRILARRLRASAEPERRLVAVQLGNALARKDEQGALALGTHAKRDPDVRSEKVVSHRYKFMWVCNPKVASRSMKAALATVDPEAVVFRNMTIEEVYSACPEALQYFTFAFVRDPCERARSFFADKLVEHPDNKWNIDRQFVGLHKGMTFAEFCRWLDTPFGSDAFAERHWLSQSKHLAIDGKLPDYIGSYENLAANWRWVSTRLAFPPNGLPHLNQRKTVVSVDDDSRVILQRRYSNDYDLVRRVGSGGVSPA